MLNSLDLFCFRNHHERHLDLAPVTVLVGNNGTGKTNIIEALYMLSLTTSWRTQRDTEVVEWDHPFCRVVSGERELVIQVSPYLKRYRIDGVSKRGHDVVGGLPSVLFQPDDMQILTGAPGFRRRFMDQVLMQVSPSYARGISTLTHILKQRNKLLKMIQEGKAQEKELHFWDEELGAVHAITRPQREKLLAWLRTRLPDIFTQMVPEVGKVEITYACSPKEEEYVTSQQFVEKVYHNRNKEISAGVSLYGPHREDFHCAINLRPISQCLSRGQTRSLLLALKMAELGFLSEMLENKPIFLLDDVLSELDGLRRERLAQLIGEYQTVISAVEWPELLTEKKKNTNLIQLV